MTCPPAVARGLLRVAVGVIALVAVVAAGGALTGRTRIGATPADTRAKIQAEVQGRLHVASAALDAAVREIADGRPHLEQSLGGASAPLRRLFDDVAAASRSGGRRLDALTVYGPEGTPLAWAGRPTSVPPTRLAGTPAFFVVPTSTGQRLVRVEPVVAAEGGRRLGAAVAEVAISAAPPGLVTSALAARISTSLGPVTLHAPGTPRPTAIPVTAVDGTTLGLAEVAEADVAAARDTWRRRVVAAQWIVVAIGALLIVGLLSDWRSATREATHFVAVSAAVLLAAGVAAWSADRALSVTDDAIRGPARFLVAMVLVLGLAWMAVTTTTRWRLATRRSARAGRARIALALFVAAIPVGALLARYGTAVSALLPPSSPIRLALLPIDAAQLALSAGLVAGHSAAFLAIVAWLSAATLVAGGMDGRRRLLSALAVTAGLVLGTAWSIGTHDAPWAPLLAVVGVLALWLATPLGRRLLERGSQPVRLCVLGVGLLVPSLSLYPSLTGLLESTRDAAIERSIAPQVVNQRRDLQESLRRALDELDGLVRSGGLADVVAAAASSPAVPSVDAAFQTWSQTVLSSRRLTSSVELYDERGQLVSRFALNLPETSADQAWHETTCGWELFEEVSPFFAEERRLLHAGRGLCDTGPDGTTRMRGSIVVHVVLDYANLPFLVAQNPYVDLLAVGTEGDGVPAFLRDSLTFVVYGWSRRPLFVTGGDAWPLPDTIFERTEATREPFWTTLDVQGVSSDVYVLNDRGGIYAVGHTRVSFVGHLAALAEIVALAGLVFAVLLLALGTGAVLGGRAPLSARALLRDVRSSFSRTLFLAFVAAVVLPVVSLALVTRAYMATQLRADIEREATRTALSASRVVEDLTAVEARGGTNLPVLDDNLLVWLSRVVGEDLNVFAGTGLLASSERNLFASGLLPTRTPGEIYRALVLEGRPTLVTRELVGVYEYLVASAPVRLDDGQAIVSVPLALRQRTIARQLDELDHRVLLAAITFILLGSAIGYWAAERISNPVSRLTRATQRLAAGDLDARLLVRSSDELGRLVAAFNGMADDLQRQREQLERTNRLEAWAEMARQVAHDIKNPLTPIQLNAEHLRRVHVDRGRPLGPLVDDCVSNILLQVRLLRQLASEFSSFASSPTARPEPTPLAALFEEILAPYERALEGRITLGRAVDADAATALVDRGLLARALTNVIENALHAMPAEGSLHAQARRGADGTIAITVTDTGIGMDEAALARIFEPYFSTKATGTGLGLTIARRNVELNGGRIEVTSARGVGTTVTLHVPAV